MSTFPTTCSCAAGWTRTQVPASARWQGTTVTICLCGNLDLGPGLARELRAFRERTGIRVELTPVEARDCPELRPGRTRPPPGCPGVQPRDPEMGPRPGDRHRPVRRPRDPAIRLRRLLAQLRNGGQRRWRACRRRGSSGDSVRRRPEGPGVLSEGRVREGRVPDPDDLGRAPRAVRSNRGGRGNAVVLRLRVGRCEPDGPAPT